MITSHDELREAAQVIRDSFRTVADDLGLTPEHWPSYVAFIDDAELPRLAEEGLSFYAEFEGDRQIGVFGAKLREDGKFWVEKVAVLPECRHRRVGRRLMEFACALARDAGAKVVRLATVDDNQVLKQWYVGMGFLQVELRHFEHVPYPVCLMEKSV
jgi:diamine N-acetyltransferase